MGKGDGGEGQGTAKEAPQAEGQDAQPGSAAKAREREAAGRAGADAQEEGRVDHQPGKGEAQKDHKTNARDTALQGGSITSSFDGVKIRTPYKSDFQRRQDIRRGRTLPDRSFMAWEPNPLRRKPSDQFQHLKEWDKNRGTRRTQKRETASQISSEKDRGTDTVDRAGKSDDLIEGPLGDRGRIRDAMKYNDKQGYSVDLVRRLEELFGHQHTKEGESGKFSRELTESIAIYQVSSGLTVDGKLGPQTLKSLREKFAWMLKDDLTGPGQPGRILVPESATEDERYDYYKKIQVENYGVHYNQPDHVNIVAIRGMKDGKHVPNEVGRSNDTFAVFWIDKEGYKHVKEWDGSVDPGIPRSADKRDTAHLKDGSYRYRLDRHWPTRRGFESARQAHSRLQKESLNVEFIEKGKSSGYTALRQASPVTVYRDRDSKREEGHGTIEADEMKEFRGDFGINIHWSGKANPASVGCQVIAGAEAFNDFIGTIQTASNKNALPYTVIDASKVTPLSSAANRTQTGETTSEVSEQPSTPQQLPENLLALPPDTPPNIPVVDIPTGGGLSLQYIPEGTTPDDLRLHVEAEAQQLAEGIADQIAKRRAELVAHGLEPKDTDVYNSKHAIGTVFFNEENRDFIIEMADRYQIDRALLAGVIAAEMDFDHDKWDSISDGIARRHWISVGEGPGVASVHEETLQHAISYLFAHSLPGHSYCDLYDRSDSNRASLEGSVEAAAIVLAMYSHAYGEIHSAEDMAVIWGAFRTGIKGFIPGDINYGYGSVEDFQQHKARGTDNLPEHLQIGTNAFMSLPYFEYFGRVMANESTLRMYANSYELFGPLTDVQP